MLPVAEAPREAEDGVLAGGVSGRLGVRLVPSPWVYGVAHVRVEHQRKICIYELFFGRYSLRKYFDRKFQRYLPVLRDYRNYLPM